jgi:methenyltetrahydrofolate cyclohydrolase
MAPITPFASLTVHDFLTATAAKQPTPGGGAVAGVAGALAAALAHMVVNYSLGKKNLVEHQPLLREASQRLERARHMLLELADEDAAAYGLVNELSKLPEQDVRRQRELPAAIRAGVAVPLAVAACATDLLRLMHDLAGKSNAYLRSDLAIAAVLAEATARSAAWNVAINVPQLPEPAEREEAARQARELVSRARELAVAVERACD